jgi:signal peptidase I
VNNTDNSNETKDYCAIDESIQNTHQKILQMIQTRQSRQSEQAAAPEPIIQPEQSRIAEKTTQTEQIVQTAPVKSAKTTTGIPPVLKDLLFLIVKIACIALVFVLLFTFLFGLIRYDDPSMEPAIKNGDLVIFYRYNNTSYLPQEAVVLDYDGQRQVRRVVATAGDIVDITEDGLVINGAVQQEPGIHQKTERYQDGVDFPLTVPEGQVFVLSDHRSGGTDSRVYGCVAIEDTLGKVMTILRRRNI